MAHGSTLQKERFQDALGQHLALKTWLLAWCLFETVEETIVLYFETFSHTFIHNFSDAISHVLPFPQFQDIGLEGAKMRPVFCAKYGMAHECARITIALLMVL